MKLSIQKINREIGALALPNVISNVSTPLISSVDTFLMGEISPVTLAAVGVGSMVFNFLYWNMGFLRMGTTGLTAQAFGRKDAEEFTQVLFKAGALGLAISLLFIILQKPLFDLAYWAMASNSLEVTEVWKYFSIRIVAAPASLLLMVMLGWLFGMQNARYPLFVTIFINSINILASFYLVRHLGYGVSGVAWGTVLAQYAGVGLCVLLIWMKYTGYFKQAKLSWKSITQNMGRLLHVNSDIFIRTLFLSTVYVLIIRFSDGVGEHILAVNIVFMQFLHWMSYAIDGFAYAAESLVGKYKGANNDNFIKLSIRWNLIWGLLFAILFTIVYAIFAEDIFTLFMESDPGGIVLNVAQEYMTWIVFVPLVGFACYIWDGIFVGLTASSAMRNSMIIAFVIFLVSYYVLPSSWSNHRLWAAFYLFLISRALFQYLLYRKYGWQLIK